MKGTVNGSSSCPPDTGGGSYGTCCYKEEDGEWILQSDDCASSGMKCVSPEEFGMKARFKGEYVRTPCVLMESSSGGGGGGGGEPGPCPDQRDDDIAEETGKARKNARQ